MASRLKIYACSGIGSTDAQSGYTYWTDNTNTIENTQAINTLLVSINTCYTEYKYLHGLTEQERLQRLNDIDLFTVCLEAAKRFKDNNERLVKAGQIIGVMIQNGVFDYPEWNEAKRDAHLDELISKANDEWDSELEISESDPEFNEWWNAFIVSRNKVGLSEQAQAATRKAIKSVKGLGKVDESYKESEIGQYLTDAGLYFPYLYFTKEQLIKLPKKTRKIIDHRRMCEKRIYNHCKAYFVDIYGSEAEMEQIIRNGIVGYTKRQPEELCEEIANGKIKGVGIIGFDDFIAAVGVSGFIAILSVASAMIVAIVKAICDAVYKSKVEKYAAMKDSIINGGQPEAGDLDEYDFGSTALGKKKSNVLWIAAAGLAALLLLRK